MTDKEAMAKELEELVGRFSEGWHEGIKIDASDIMLLSQAAEVLAQPELCKYGQEPKSCTSNPMDCQCALDAALAQPEQEPVVGTKTWFEDGKVVTQNLHHSDVYTTPPQRTWVGLFDTDEGVSEIAALSFADKFSFAKAIEAKLKEKNNV